ncbi:hypothetical protein D8T54_13860 [Vibrio vulnificus]|nr:hypothetical protein D8T54_13860 [Vibrio vulnificus]
MLFQWIEKQIPRPERPHASLSNLKAKEAENRSATRDQAPLKGELILIWRSQAPVLKFELFNYPDELGLAYSTVFGGKPPKQNPTSGEVSL